MLRPLGFVNMFRVGQVVEKNHFPGEWNRHMSLSMTEIDRQRSRFLLVMIASALALATLAPIAVLAG
jgi:hypothetical protein